MLIPIELLLDDHKKILKSAVLQLTENTGQIKNLFSAADEKKLDSDKILQQIGHVHKSTQALANAYQSELHHLHQKIDLLTTELDKKVKMKQIPDKFCTQETHS